jgi:hypothetical protein
MRTDCDTPATVHGVFTWSATDAPSQLDTGLELCQRHAAEEDELGALHRHFLFVARVVCNAVKRPHPADTRLTWRPIHRQPLAIDLAPRALVRA